MASNQNLERATADIAWLSNSILHDLRNPLTTISTAAELLIDFDSVPPQVKRLAANIFRAADSMRSLLADFTEEVLEIRSTRQISDIRDIVISASKAAMDIVQPRGVQVLIDIPAQLRLPVVCARIERVFMNLIINSLQAMPSGGEVNISARTTSTCVLIDVKDTGPGIPEHIRHCLFEQFVTADKKNGMGMGLALSRKTVLDHGGDMWIEPATGAHFVLSLPLNAVGANSVAEVGTLVTSRNDGSTTPRQ